MYLRQLDNLVSGKDVGTCEGGVLVTQDRMTDNDAANVDAKSKTDAPDASNIGTPKIDVNTGIGKTCVVETKLSRLVYLIHQSLRDDQSDGEDKDTGKFDAKEEA